jgi:putative transposase
VTDKYEFIDAEYAALPAEGEAPTVAQMCGWLEISKSGFYDWRNRPQSKTAQRRELLKIKVKALFEANNEEYGTGGSMLSWSAAASPPTTRPCGRSCVAWAWSRASRSPGGTR